MRGWEWAKRALGILEQEHLKRAITSGWIGGARRAVRRGAKLSGEGGDPALCLALKFSPNAERMCEELLRLGARVDQPSPLCGSFPLHLALFCDRSFESALPVAQALIGAGADPNAINRQGDTPLSLVVMAFNFNFSEYGALRVDWATSLSEALMEAGADLWRSGPTGEAPGAALHRIVNEIEMEFEKKGAMAGFMTCADPLAIAKLKALLEKAVLSRSLGEGVSKLDKERQGEPPPRRARL